MSTPLEIARTVYTKLTAQPELHDQVSWWGEQRCIGGWVLHEAGITIHGDHGITEPYHCLTAELPEHIKKGIEEDFPRHKDRSRIEPDIPAQLVLGLTRDQAFSIFYRSNAGAMASLARVFGL